MQYVISFLEGIITFISPCLLPMIPIYLTYFAGSGERTTKKTVTGALGFVSGFTLVFVTMGALAGRATASLDSAGAAITGQVAAMQENVQTAKDAVQVLLPGGSSDPDSIQAATNALSSSFQGMQSNMQNISSATL